MCGFVAIVTPAGKTVSSAVLHEMTERLAHRGPDGFGYACIDPRTGESEDWRTHCPRPALSGVLLGHRRLCILDLAAGHQPMFRTTGRRHRLQRRDLQLRRAAGGAGAAGPVFHSSGHRGPPELYCSGARAASAGSTACGRSPSGICRARQLVSRPATGSASSRSTTGEEPAACVRLRDQGPPGVPGRVPGLPERRRGGVHRAHQHRL